MSSHCVVRNFDKGTTSRASHRCMRDIDNNTTAPYNTTGLETALGLFNSQDEVKKGLEFYAEFAKNVTALTEPPPALYEDSNAVGLYVPLHYYQTGDPNNTFNLPPKQAGHATVAYHLLHALGETQRVVRGDLPLPLPVTQLKVLVVTSATLVSSEIAALRQWVSGGGRLIWHGLAASYFTSNTDAEALVGAKGGDFSVSTRAQHGAVATPTTSSVHFGGRSWTLGDWLDAKDIPVLTSTTASKVRLFAVSCFYVSSRSFLTLFF
jgi:hypothetical protein